MRDLLKRYELTRRDFLKRSAAWLAAPVALRLPIINAAGPKSILIENGLLIDGTGKQPLEKAFVLIEDGRFKSISARRLKPPAGATIIDASGKTILPGLIDMHAHLLSGGFDTITEKSMSYDPTEQLRALRQSIYWGVTGIYSPVQPLEQGVQMRAQTSAGDSPFPRLFISGPGFTAPGGWAGSNDPSARYEPESAQEIKQQVARLRAARVDILKVFYDDMSHAFVSPLPKLDKRLLQAVIAEAHAQKLKVMVHAYETANHKESIRAGADIMAHSAVTDPIDDEYIELARKNRTLYLATLSVYHDVFDKEAIRNFIKNDYVKKTVPQKTLITLSERGALDEFEKTIRSDYFKKQLPLIMSNLKRVSDAGVAVAVGPDTGVPGAFPGIAVHREMELMVQAGVPPAKVLAGATRVAADYLGQSSLGAIEAGKIADVVIVNGNPLKEITGTRDIDTVIKEGNIIDRQRLLAEVMGTT
ncbi:MAG TPA: amidohydrolase family protein [Blastocatellia bacterium]|nr:amidohydrolase family protein [Blastocatellia bacterium]